MIDDRPAAFATPRALIGARRFEPLTLALGVVMLGAHAGAIALAARGHVAAAAACGLVAAWIAFTCLHEASHGNVGRGRALNAVAGELAAHVLGARFLAFRQIHQRHHRHAGDRDRDPDRWTGLGPGWARALRLATTDLHYYAEYRAAELRASPLEAALSAASTVALVAGLAGLGLWLGPIAVLAAWVVPARLALFAAAYFADVLPHGRRDDHADPTAPWRSARLVRVGPLGSALLLGHAQHLLHHVWPRVPFHALPRLARERRDALREAAVVEVDLFGRPVGPRPAPRRFELPSFALRRLDGPASRLR